MLKCLQKIPAQDLLDYQSKMDNLHKFFIFVIPMPPFFGGKQADELFRHPKNVEYLCGMEENEFVEDEKYWNLAEVFGYRNVIEVEGKYRRDRMDGKLGEFLTRKVSWIFRNGDFKCLVKMKKMFSAVRVKPIDC